MSRIVYQWPDRLWAWSATAANTAFHYAEGLESYPDVGDAAGKAMRWVLKEAPGLGRAHYRTLVDHALHTSSEPARQVITKKRTLADTATVPKIAVAGGVGLFEYDVCKNSTEMMAKDEVAAFLRMRSHHLS